MTFPAGWSRQCQITLPYSYVAASQSNFPWVFIQNAFPSEFWTYIQNSGADIRFTSDQAGTVPLHFEIASINKGSSTIQTWAKIPSLSASSPGTKIWVWYGNASATPPAPSDSSFGSQGVWDANYLGVWHLEQTSGQKTDSTSNGFNSTALSLIGEGTATGQIGHADQFNGTSNYVQLPSTIFSTVTNQLTLSAWINTSKITGYGEIIRNDGGAGSYGILLRQNGANVLFDMLGTGGVGVTGTTSLLTGTWYYVCGTYNGSTVTLYTNGGVDGTPASMTHNYNQTGLSVYFGTYGSGEWFYGTLDEIRISKIGRSANWVQTEYNNQNNLSTSGTPGTPHAAPAETVRIFIDGAYS